MITILYLLTDGVQVVKGSQFGDHSSGPIFLDQLHCTGDEESLSECDMNTEPGIHMCGHQHDVGVICQCKMMLILYQRILNVPLNLVPVTHQRPVSVMWTMVVVTTTAQRPYKVISAPAILDTH